jgi:hypothetical protein
MVVIMSPVKTRRTANMVVEGPANSGLDVVEEVPLPKPRAPDMQASKRLKLVAQAVDNADVIGLDNSVVRPEDSWGSDKLKEAVRNCARIRGGRQTEDRIHMCDLAGGRVVEQQDEHRGVMTTSYKVYFYNPHFLAECDAVAASKRMKGKEPRYPRPIPIPEAERMRFAFGSLDAAVYYIEKSFMRTGMQDIDRELTVLRWNNDRLTKQAAEFEEAGGRNQNIKTQLLQAEATSKTAQDLVNTLKRENQVQLVRYDEKLRELNDAIIWGQNLQKEIQKIKEEFAGTIAARDDAIAARDTSYDAIRGVVGFVLQVATTQLPEPRN